MHEEENGGNGLQTVFVIFVRWYFLRKFDDVLIVAKIYFYDNNRAT